MPKITEKPIEIAGQKWPVAVWYDSTRKFYVKQGLPPNMDKVVELRPLTGCETEKELNEALTRLIKEYELKIKSERQVLLIEGTLGWEVAAALGWPRSADNEHPLAPTNSGPSNYGFDFKFCRAKEFAVGEKKDYRPYQDADDTNRWMKLPNGFFRPTHRVIVMEYTEDRMQFLLTFQQAVVAQGRLLAHFFTKDEQLLIDRVEEAQQNNQLLLGGPLPGRTHVLLPLN